MNRRDALKNTGLILGYSISASGVAAVMNGCKAPTAAGWIPISMDSSTASIVAEVAETILPATDTPGAKEVLVDRFIDEILSHAYGPNQRAHMLTGINGFDSACNEKMGSSFLKLDESKKQEYLIHLEEEANALDKAAYAARAAKNKAENEDKEPPRAGPMVREERTEFGHYYKELKGLILAGYFTSQKIGTEVLAYDPIPQVYDPCMEISEDTKAWSF